MRSSGERNAFPAPSNPPFVLARRHHGQLISNFQFIRLPTKNLTVARMGLNRTVGRWLHQRGDRSSTILPGSAWTVALGRKLGHPPPELVGRQVGISMESSFPGRSIPRGAGSTSIRLRGHPFEADVQPGDVAIERRPEQRIALARPAGRQIRRPRAAPANEPDWPTASRPDRNWRTSHAKSAAPRAAAGPSASPA